MIQRIHRFLWNLYYTVELVRESGAGYREAWRCARESDSDYDSGAWPQEAAGLEAEIRAVEGNIRYKLGSRKR